MRERLGEALKQALKTQDKRRTSTLRLISAAITDRDIAARSNGKERVSDEELLQILVKMIKQRDESARLYEDGGRIDLAEQEREELGIIREFLPRQFSEEEVRSACRVVVDETGAHGLRDVGRCMSALKERYPGKMDFAKASGVVKGLLKEE
ncbi:GatB/YqeY domain-containing protein [Methylobrevis albus]|uniref:GatB/YqeY domain-containing protein n=1 Tax=Methylobrevis albus TaxID=2793297 RepID=A0A931MW86_9HYPH|nr:GatB/YqeY domain-containing protein [Methylobrevis albus]MBH0236348.1 GatB/YqeY domain-containing protein [Methylobrevis albus]